MNVRTIRNWRHSCISEDANSILFTDEEKDENEKLIKKYSFYRNIKKAADEMYKNFKIIEKIVPPNGCQIDTDRINRLSDDASAVQQLISRIESELPVNNEFKSLRMLALDLVTKSCATLNTSLEFYVYIESCEKQLSSFVSIPNMKELSQIYDDTYHEIQFFLSVLTIEFEKEFKDIIEKRDEKIYEDKKKKSKDFFDSESFEKEIRRVNERRIQIEHATQNMNILFRALDIVE